MQFPLIATLESVRKFLNEFASSEQLPEYGTRFKYIEIMVCTRSLSFSLILLLTGLRARNCS